MDRVRTQTKYRRKNNLRFYLFHMFARSISTYFIIVAAIAMLVLAIITTLKPNPNQTSIMFSWILTGFCLMLIPLLLIFRLNDVIKQETAALKISTERIEVTKHKIERNNTAIEGKFVLNWKRIKVVCETKGYFYFYTEGNNGLILVKADIIEGDVALLRKIINQNAPLNRRGKPVYKKYFREPKAKAA